MFWSKTTRRLLRKLRSWTYLSLGKKKTQRLSNILDSLWYSHQPRVCTGWRGHFGQVSCGPTACGEPSLWPEKQINLSKGLPVMLFVLNYFNDRLNGCMCMNSSVLYSPNQFAEFVNSFSEIRYSVYGKIILGPWGSHTFFRNSNYNNVIYYAKLTLYSNLEPRRSRFFSPTIV